MEATKLKDWVEAQGGKKIAAKKLKVTQRSVEKWMAGQQCPTVTMMLKIEKLSNKTISVYDLIAETRRAM